MDRSDATRNVPPYIEGDVNAKIETCTQTTRRDGTKALRVDMVVSADGNDWYALTTYISFDPKFKWLHKVFWLALGYSDEQMENMDLTDESLYREYCTYLVVNIAHSGRYVNIKKWYPKKKNNYIPVPWHFPEYEKFGGVAYQVQPQNKPKNEHDIEDLLLGETKHTADASELTPQTIDLSWVLTENLIAELKRRGISINDIPQTKPKQLSRIEGYDFGDDDLDFA